MKKILLAGLATGIMLLGITGVANATIKGEIWAGPGADAASIDPELIPAGSPNFTFTVDKINFDSRRPTSNTYDTFLKGGNGLNINNLVWIDLIDPTYSINSFWTSTGHGSFFRFTGVGYFEADMAIEHDDGFFLTLNGVPYDYSTPTVPKTHHLGNAAGYYTFSLQYGAYNNFPEVLIAPIAPIPEPTTTLLVGLGVAGLVGVARRRRS